MEKILQILSVPLNAQRAALVRQVFRRLDDDGDGLLRVRDLRCRPFLHGAIAHVAARALRIARDSSGGVSQSSHPASDVCGGRSTLRSRMFVMWVGQTLDAHLVPTAQLGSAF